MEEEMHRKRTLAVRVRAHLAEQVQSVGYFGSGGLFFSSFGFFIIVGLAVTVVAASLT